MELDEEKGILTEECFKQARAMWLIKYLKLTDGDTCGLLIKISQDQNMVLIVRNYALQALGHIITCNSNISVNILEARKTVFDRNADPGVRMVAAVYGVTQLFDSILPQNHFGEYDSFKNALNAIKMICDKDKDELLKKLASDILNKYQKLTGRMEQLFFESYKEVDEKLDIPKVTHRTQSELYLTKPSTRNDLDSYSESVGKEIKSTIKKDDDLDILKVKRTIDGEEKEYEMTRYDNKVYRLILLNEKGGALPELSNDELEILLEHKLYLSSIDLSRLVEQFLASKNELWATLIARRAFEQELAVVLRGDAILIYNQERSPVSIPLGKEADKVKIIGIFTNVFLAQAKEFGLSTEWHEANFKQLNPLNVEVSEYKVSSLILRDSPVFGAQARGDRERAREQLQVVAGTSSQRDHLERSDNKATMS